MDKVCKVTDCANGVLAKGYCGGHYNRVRVHGDPQEHKPLQRKGKTDRKTCRVNGCDAPIYVKLSELCSAHYLRMKRKGDPEASVAFIVGDDAARFWSYVDTTGGPDACHPWTGGVRAPKHSPGHRYGRIKINGKMVTATRYLIEIIGGRALATGEEVCHTCDNSLCVNPRHIFIGTHTDNMRDMESKGRRRVACGERVQKARFTDEQVLEIRRLHAGGMGTYRLAKRYRTYLSTIQRIVRRDTWKHLP